MLVLGVIDLTGGARVRNSSGATVASGVYFVRMRSQSDNGNFSAPHKLLFMK